MQTHNTNVFDDAYLAPSYNVAPRSFQPVVSLIIDTSFHFRLAIYTPSSMIWLTTYLC